MCKPEELIKINIYLDQLIAKLLLSKASTLDETLNFIYDAMLEYIKDVKKFINEEVFEVVN